MSSGLALKSRLNTVSPILKFALAALFMALALAVGGRAFHIALSCLMLLTSLLSLRGAFGQCLRLYRAPIAFALTGALASALALSSEPPEGSLQLFRLFGQWLFVSKAQAGFALSLFLKSAACISVLITLASSTPAEHFLWLFEKLRAPKTLVELMLLTLRFLYLLGDTQRALERAQESRCSQLGFMTRARAASMLISSVFVRSWVRASEVASAMDARCYTGEMAYIGSPGPAGAPHIALSILLAAAMGSLAIIW